MTRKAWAGGLLALLIIAGCAFLALHLREDETGGYVLAAVRPAASARPYDGWPSGAVNVNTADFDELQTLTGINSGQIEALIDDRERNGPFDFPEDLIAVKGIGEKTLAKIYRQLDFTWRLDGD